MIRPVCLSGLSAGLRIVAASCSLPLLAAVAPIAAESARVPLSLGRGTGGRDGEWAPVCAQHSPTSVKVDAGAGPEGTPAAVVEFKFAPGKYNWTWAEVAVGQADPGTTVAVRLTFRTDVPPGFPALNVMLRESTGASYWVPEAALPSPSRFRTVTIPLTSFSVPSWSKDDNGKLDAELVTHLSVGLASGAAGPGRIVIAEVQLVPAGW